MTAEESKEKWWIKMDNRVSSQEGEEGGAKGGKDGKDIAEG